MKCEGIKSLTSPGKPAAVCRDCALRYAWLRTGDSEYSEAPKIAPAAHYGIGAQRLACINKVKA